MCKKIITLGMFDGVHIGHQHIINNMYKIAKFYKCIPTIITFNYINNKNQSIFLTNEKIKKIKSLYSDIEVILLNFYSGIRLINWYDFIFNIIFNKFNVFGIVLGIESKFGYKSIGNTFLLKKICDKLGILCFFIENVTYNKITISSTHIKKLINNGKIKKINIFLGYNYFINGIVKKGKKIGRVLGYKTINIIYNKNLVHLPNGVYITKTFINNKSYYSITNIGFAPTFVNKIKNINITIETHIFNFDKYIYNKTVTIQFLRFIRNEIKFLNFIHLKNQIYNDILITKKFIKMKDKL